LKFLIDASLPRDVARIIASHGHQGIDVRDIGLRSADDSVIASHAQAQRIALISGDFDFADIRVYPPQDYFGLVIIDRPEHPTVAQVLAMVERLLTHHNLLANLVGRLIIVDEWHIRVRQPVP